jgi:sugar phosphate isomerase/epimerase
VTGLRRREFLAACGAAALARSPIHGASGVSSPRLRPFAGLPGIQLYTVRGELAKDFEGTLARLAEMGYREVEFVSTHGRKAADVRAVLDRLGLSAVSRHIAPDAIETDWGRTFGEAAELGCRYLVVAWLPAETRKTVDDWRRWGRRLTRAGEAARRAGLGFAYHNHDFEFRPVARRIPFDVLLRESDPRWCPSSWISTG